MTAWQRLAWIEWYRSVFFGKENRDFFWLTLLLTLTLLLALLLWGGREGLLNKFIDVSVGYVENAGIPIWLVTNQVEGIDRTILMNSDLKIYPYREVESHEVALPTLANLNSDIWEKTEVTFQGWAVRFSDPLWKIPTSNSSIPLQIILNEALFKRYFNCKPYLTVLQQRLPFLKRPPPSQNPLFCLESGILWLEVKIGQERELVPFQIHWQSQIPTLQKLAFLFPLSTLNTLKIAKRYPDIHYYPEVVIDPEKLRVKQLMLWTADERSLEELIAPLLSCWSNARREHQRITFAYPLPESWASQCLIPPLSLQRDEELLPLPTVSISERLVSEFSFNYTTDDYLILSCNQSCSPCEKIPALRKLGNAIICQNQRAILDVIATTGSYQKGFIYAPDRHSLSQQIAQITDVHTPSGKKAFYIHPTYQDALVRFQFITAIIALFETFFQPFFLIFLWMLLFVQLGIVIAHRQHHYAILLAKGLSWSHIRQLILTQVTLSFLVAVGSTVIVTETTQMILTAQVTEILTKEPYHEHIVASQLNLLPLLFWDYVKVSIFILLNVLVAILLLLKIMIAQRYKEPAYLL